MYKQYNNFEQYYNDLAYLDQKCIEKNIGEKYQDIIKHPIQDVWYISFCRINEFEDDYINQEWLSTDIISDLPSDFYWFDSNRNYRLVCATSLVLSEIVKKSEIGNLLYTLIDDFKAQIQTIGENTYIYLATLDDYKGISIDYLLSTYPDIFLRTEQKQ